MTTNVLSMARELMLLEPKTYAANSNGPWIDLRQFTGTIRAIFNVTTPTGDHTLVLSAQDSPDGATDPQTIATAPEINNSTGGGVGALVFRPEQTRGFVRLVATVGGTTPMITLAVTGIAMPKNRVGS